MKTIAAQTIRNSLTIGLCVLAVTSIPALSLPAATTGIVSEQILTKDLGLLENRFFSRQYANDPVEKRLERLELLVFGSTQDGTLEQRWGRLNKSIANRAAAEAKEKSASANNVGGTKTPDTSSQYPALNTLEWRALKKTFPSESLDQRLARIEKKLFGQDSPGMAYADRVDRLKRTLGVGVTAAVPTGPIGPAPKARPRNSIDSFNYNFGAPSLFGQGEQTYGDEGLLKPFGGSLGGNLHSTFAQMFADLNREMADLDDLNLGAGSWVLDPKTGTWVEQFSGRRVKPGAPQAPQTRPQPKLPTPQTLPFQFRQNNGNNMNTLPPYADPNSI